MSFRGFLYVLSWISLCPITLISLVFTGFFSIRNQVSNQECNQVGNQVNQSRDTRPTVANDNGFYIQTTLAPYGGTQAATSSYFLITTYGGKTIKHNKTATNLMAGLRTYYPSSHYSWGNVTLAWSEDYVEDGSERLNW
jgi:hypothetical protein